MTSAAEQAVSLIEQQFFNGLPDTALESAVVIADALMANPDLLVDLAIEAGGLVRPIADGGGNRPITTWFTPRSPFGAFTVRRDGDEPSPDEGPSFPVYVRREVPQ